MSAESRRPATLRDACDIVRAIGGDVHRAGYLVALYGSVLRDGSGQDIDLLLVPWHGDASPTAAIRTIALLLGGVEVGERYHGAMGTLATTILAHDVVLDVQVRETETGNPELAASASPLAPYAKMPYNPRTT